MLTWMWTSFVFLLHAAGFDFDVEGKDEQLALGFAARLKWSGYEICISSRNNSKVDSIVVRLVFGYYPL